MKANSEMAGFGPLPSKAQLRYHEDELAAFIHFGINTFYDQEWGNGQEDPQRFNPSALDTDQWIRVLKETGFKRVIVVVKHHDGFVLYPSRWTDHTIAASPWRDGKGDVLAEVSKSASKYDMDLGIYLSPWDAHSPLYHVETQEAYNHYYLQQLKEILANPLYGNKGKFVEVWMDGARGEGAQKLVYDYPAWLAAIAEAQSDALVFSTEATGIRWIGNENGRAGDPLWQKVNPNQLSEHTAPAYLNHGDPDGTVYSLGEADVSIRSGWFYHTSQRPKSLADLLDIYLHSVGRGTPLLLNVPPTEEGLLAAADVERLQEFHEAVTALYAADLALGAEVWADSEHPDCPAGHLTDGRPAAFWMPASDQQPFTLELDLGQDCLFDTVELREDMAQGQRVASFYLEVEKERGWAAFAAGKTIGYKRLLLGDAVWARRLRLVLTDVQAPPILTKWSVYKAPQSMEKRSCSAALLFERPTYHVASGQSVQVRLQRQDGLTIPESIRLVTEPGTGVHGVAYQDQVFDLHFAAGEAFKEVGIASLAFSGERSLDFYLCASRPDGRQSRTKIIVRNTADE
ncbi:alpha-L-fucosidase [Streptococcus panodentis]|uniref:alpha-L-fucosidase n=1 Tax=Streptococcus panodentis TaxID=1581472 RepID=A0ABS5AZE2_9STRE|nr:alpha-L-fucosidase [Streptococcus panodentis]MBP2621940.1 alpha-L-fucosidase [Streptococcus panodentis]